MVTLKDPKLVFKTNYRLMQVKSIADCSKGSILQYFRPSLSYHLSLKALFCLFLSGRFTQVLLYSLGDIFRRISRRITSRPSRISEQELSKSESPCCPDAIQVSVQYDIWSMRCCLKTSKMAAILAILYFHIPPSFTLIQQTDQSFCLSLEYFMNIDLLTEQHFEFLCLKGGCTGSAESTLVKMPHCCKSPVTAHMCMKTVWLHCFQKRV